MAMGPPITRSDRSGSPVKITTLSKVPITYA